MRTPTSRRGQEDIIIDIALDLRFESATQAGSLAPMARERHRRPLGESSHPSSIASALEAGDSAPAVEPPHWLDRRERAAWLATSSIMISLPAALDARMQRESQLTFFEYMVLSVLSEETGHEMQMSALAARTAASLSRLSHVAGRLEKRGLLVRNRLPGAGRRTSAVLTHAGLEAVMSAAPGHVAAVREYLIDHLDPSQLAALESIGSAVRAAVAGESTVASSPA